MADIKQAAKRMQQGKHVRRPKWKTYWFRYSKAQDRVLDKYGYPAEFDPADLLADDWEVAP